MMISSYGHGSILLAFRTALFAALTGKWTYKRDDDGKKKWQKQKIHMFVCHVCLNWFENAPFTSSSILSNSSHGRKRNIWEPQAIL